MSRVLKPADRMILPTADTASGEVIRHRLLCDDRIPIRLSHDRPVRLLGYWDRPAQCPDGRHLWDAIVATAPDVAPGPEEDEDRLRFRLALTCVRCGRIEGLQGVMHDDGRCRPRRVDPEPLRAGGLLAQQVGTDRFGGDLTSWPSTTARTVNRSVHQLGERRSWSALLPGPVRRLAGWPDGRGRHGDGLPAQTRQGTPHLRQR
jgi:hypothetical protein